MASKKHRKTLFFPLMCLLVFMILCLFPAHCFATDEISLKAEAVSAQPGSEVNMPIFIEANPGIASLKFTVKYDDTNLTLTNITFPKNSGTYSSVPEPFSGNQIINFVSPLAAFYKTGLFATLTFSVNENADTNKFEPIAIEFNEEDIFDMDFTTIRLTLSSEGIYISDQSAESIAKLPSVLTRIEDEAFMNTSFSYVDLPETVTMIGSKAFANCSNLNYIYIPEATTSIASDAFLNTSNLTIIGKAGSYAEFYASRNRIAFQTR